MLFPPSFFSQQKWRHLLHKNYFMSTFGTFLICMRLNHEAVSQFGGKFSFPGMKPDVSTNEKMHLDLKSRKFYGENFHVILQNSPSPLWYFSLFSSSLVYGSLFTMGIKLSTSQFPFGKTFHPKEISRSQHHIPPRQNKKKMTDIQKKFKNSVKVEKRANFFTYYFHSRDQSCKIKIIQYQPV